IGILACGPLTTIPGIILGMTELNAIRKGRAPKAGETYAKISLYGSIGTTALATLSCILGSVIFMWWMKMITRRSTEAAYTVSDGRYLQSLHQCWQRVCQ